MSSDQHQSRTKALCEIVKKVSPTLSFTIFEIGAVPLQRQAEPFHALLDYFPQSQIIAFEVDEKLCSELNEKARPGLTYYPVALGLRDEECTFYETNHPMCASLYRPNEALLQKYHYLDVAMLKSTGTLKTKSLDNFVREKGLAGVDFIKIDIQGAELDVFRGGAEALSRTVFIVTEVEFIPLYVDQPLFGDVSEYLVKQNFMFHKFLGMAGRTLKPIYINQDPNFAGQHMWSDAVFMRDINKLSDLSPAGLLKMAILAFVYHSPDVSVFCLQKYDQLADTNISQEMMTIFS